MLFFFFQAEDGIRDLVRSRGLGDVYKRQAEYRRILGQVGGWSGRIRNSMIAQVRRFRLMRRSCLLYTSDAADEGSSVDLGGRRLL